MTTYLLIAIINLATMMDRLDVIVVGQPGTSHYTAPIYSPMATVTTCLLPLDDRAETVLTPEEWASRLATMPVEFVVPNP